MVKKDKILFFFVPPTCAILFPNQEKINDLEETQATYMMQVVYDYMSTLSVFEGHGAAEERK